ncbi:helix-turn-helix domain-containing protein [Streptomyces endophyticus]|uniref:Helix-turn-helix domain-containing protein n=1 Tax=Streptomyces endophyticus TaxID=714166 RepID=A0ABU6F7I3_9ACTN|nr:helix-turn-helix domain-containing protein [Streptomyces endophyticus]MEB8339433.1 helix-turn-helix domain-containing protein [Streptomyces endophyticus]
MNQRKPESANPIDWNDLKDELDFSPEEQEEIREGTAALLSEVRAYRLAEIRKRQHMTQATVAEALGVTQGRVSAIEKGKLTRSEVETVAAYVAVLGGTLRLVADFGDESLVLG